MKTRGILWISAGILIFALFTAWIRLPLVSSDIWMSPDETANMISAISFANDGIFSFSSSLTSEFIWAHPRSFVFVPETNMVAPIGFLGMPFILGIIYKLFGLIGINFFAPFLALITLYPLWRSLPKNWPKAVKLMSLIIWMSFPSIVLYTNRGAFPQLTQLCFVIWAWFLIQNTETEKYQKKQSLQQFILILSGFLTGLALMIRPIEAIWILPVVFFAFLNSKKIKLQNTFKELLHIGHLRQIAIYLVPLVLVLLVGAKLGADTYGRWFVSGYQIRPEIVENIASSGSEIASQSDAVSIFTALPFSFHPRNIWWNLKNYVIWFFLPWFVLLLGSLVMVFKEKIWKTESGWAIIALAWSSVALIIFYGNGIYQDHVRINEISIGNSFIRYILPISLTFTVSAGFVFSRLWRHWSLKLIAICLAIALTSFGLFTAISRDDEGVLNAEQELISYSLSRDAAQKNFSDGSIIISDRSDKIFFPNYLAISPMPSAEQIFNLYQNGAELGLYLPTQNEAGIQEWGEKGFILRPIFTTGNQTLYDVY